MLYAITDNYNKKDNGWFCKKCNGEIYSGKKSYISSCSCLDKKSQYKIYTDYLGHYYIVEGSKWICNQCKCSIQNKRELHAFSCNGIGTKHYIQNNGINSNLFSKTCDFGCGQESKFFYKSGKSYCCKLGAKCPVKSNNDREKKIGVNPFEGKEHPRGMLGKNPYNKGLTKETSEKVAQNSLALKEFYKKNVSMWVRLAGTQKEKEIKAKLSRAAKVKGFGGITKGGGRGKKGWYKGFFCDSSWELAYIIYCLEHEISITRNTEKRTYQYKGKTRGYFPDFWVNGVLTEIKGYTSEQWQAKLAANPDVKPLYKEDMKPILKYVVDKYGKDYIKLYEKNK